MAAPCLGHPLMGAQMKMLLSKNIFCHSNTLSAWVLFLSGSIIQVPSGTVLVLVTQSARQQGTCTLHSSFSWVSSLWISILHHGRKIPPWHSCSQPMFLVPANSASIVDHEWDFRTTVGSSWLLVYIHFGGLPYTIPSIQNQNMPQTSDKYFSSILTHKNSIRG